MADGPQPVDIAQRLYAMGVGTGAASGGGKSWLDKPMNQGAAMLTATAPSASLSNRGVLVGTGRGMFGGAGDKLHAAIAQCGEAFLKNICTGVQTASADQIFGHGLDTGGFSARVSAPSSQHHDIEV